MRLSERCQNFTEMRTDWPSAARHVPASRKIGLYTFSFQPKRLIPADLGGPWESVFRLRGAVWGLQLVAAATRDFPLENSASLNET